MKRLPYRSHLPLAARWFLPPGEAREVVEDYREIIREAACHAACNAPVEFGKPVQIIRPLAQTAAYRRWLAAFAAMALCLLQPALWLITRAFHPGAAALLLAAGAAFSLAYFRRQEPVRQRPPKSLFIALACLAALSSALLGAALWCMAHPAVWLYLAKYPHSSRIGLWFSSILLGLGVLSAAAGFLGLLGARLSDRRWRALYILGMAVITVCALILSILHSMDPTARAAHWQAALYTRCLLTGLLGLVLTGVGLC